MFGELLAAAILVCAVPLWIFAAERAWLTLVALGAARRVRRGGAGSAVWPRSGADGTAPMVTVQLPLYNEPAVAERLIAAAQALAWPRDRLELQVLDDSTDETTDLVAAAVARARAAGVTAHHVRRGGRSGYKAGALAHGLRSARGELILVLDADFVPPPDLLRRTTFEFDDETVAVVQTAWGHLNRETGLLTRAQALMLDGHFHVEQRARHAAARFFNFNGTAGIWRRSAIDDAGGWSADTLTEDLDLSYRAQLRGWRFVYRDDVVAPAELPITCAAWKSQQYRWAKGSAQCAKKLVPAVVAAPLPARVRATALLHLTSNFSYPLTLGLALLCAALELPLVRGHAGAAIATLALTWPLFAAATLGYVGYYLASSRQGLARTLAAMPLVMATGLGLTVNQTRAVSAGLRRHVGEFVRTPKSGTVGRGPSSGSRHAAAAPAAGRGQRLVEAGLALVFTVALALAIERGGSPAIALHALAAVGLGAVAWRGRR
jgi:hypothetical protein